MEHYIGGPTHEDKENYSDSLFDYAKGDNKRKSDGEQKEKPKKLKDAEPQLNLQDNMPENVPESNAIIPLQPNFEMEQNLPVSQNLVQNTLRQAANMFQNATFNNCTINFQMPK